MEVCDTSSRANEEMERSIEDLMIRLKELEKLTACDPGPIYDCVVFHDGRHWRAVIDTSECGDLESCHKPMTDYRIENSVACFSRQSMLNFTVDIFAEGTTLSVVFPNGPHGTHVAGIVGAHYPPDPSIDGLAPAAHLVSIKIGDARDSNAQETLTGLLRAVRSAVDCRCDVVNMSYVETSPFDAEGLFHDFIGEMVDKHGIIFVTSAGNLGPAMTSIGANASSRACLSVGALVSGEMMRDGMELTGEMKDEMNFTWSSKGPCRDGHM
eukprot:21983_1